MMTLRDGRELVGWGGDGGGDGEDSELGRRGHNEHSWGHGGHDRREDGEGEGQVGVWVNGRAEEGREP